MKKEILILVSFITLGFCSFVDGHDYVHAVSNDDYDINEVIDKYYNNGKYTRRTWIDLSSEAMKDSLENYFVAQKISLQRTTYFSDESLLMGNIDGSIGGEQGINSGYTTIDNCLYHYEVDEDDYSLIDESLKLNVNDTSVTDFFVTMKTFENDYVNEEWESVNRVYSYYPEDTSFNVNTQEYNDKILDDFLMFTASCFYNTDKENLNYIGLDHVEIEEVNNHLELRLYADQLDSGKVNNDQSLLSVARVYKGFLPQDNTGLYLFNDDQYIKLSNSVLKDVFLLENSSVSIYDSTSQTYSDLEIKVTGYYNIKLTDDSNVSLTLIYEEAPERKYTESNDEVNGIDLKDLSRLKNALRRVNNNYTLSTRTYFNKAAVERVNKIYDTTYVQSKVTKVTEDSIYISDKTGQVNEYYTYENGIKVGTLEDGQVKGLEYLTQNDQVISTSLSEYFFTMENLNSAYIDKYGPCKVSYTSDYSVEYQGWTRLSKNKFKCDREEVIKHFMKFLAPGFSNGGTYMTFRYVTVEILRGYELKIRLYASPTQIGKMIDDHKDLENKPDWYLLFAEGFITEIDSTRI